MDNPISFFTIGDCGTKGSNITLTEPTLENLLTTFSAHSNNPNVRRTQTRVHLCDNTDPVIATLSYIGVMGLLDRFADAQDEKQKVWGFEELAYQSSQLGYDLETGRDKKWNKVHTIIQPYGQTPAPTDTAGLYAAPIPYNPENPLTAFSREEIIRQIRYSRYVSVELPFETGTLPSWEILVWLTGLRSIAETKQWRIPKLLHNGEHVDLLNMVWEVRKLFYTIADEAVTVPVAEKPEPNPNRQLLSDHYRKHRIVPILEALESTMNPETGLWRCPRGVQPRKYLRHAHGDSNPSLQVDEEELGVLCYVCDGEWVDAVGLVADTLEKSGTESVRWVLNNEQNQR